MSLATLQVAVERDWLVIGVAIASTIITLLAVLVALVGPLWREAQKRPSLTLGIEKDWKAGMIFLTVTNDHRKHTATDVEIHIIEIHHASGPLNLPFAISPNAMSMVQPRVGRPLRASESIETSATQTIPSGFTRRWDFLAHADDRQRMLAREKAPQGVLLMVLPEPQDIEYLWPYPSTLGKPTRAAEHTARILIAVAGSNAITREYTLLVGYFPCGISGYEHSIDEWFDICVTDVIS